MPDFQKETLSGQWLSPPNLLSLLRILLIPPFCILFFTARTVEGYLLAGSILVLSGVTDMLDGFIARKHDMITDLGKILDPLADKLTQVTVCLCLAVRKKELFILLIFFILKEVVMLAGGLIILHKNHRIEGAKWFGKVNTIVFYAVMIAVISFPMLPQWVVWLMVGCSLTLMFFSFFKYLSCFFQAIKKEKPCKCPAKDGHIHGQV